VTGAALRALRPDLVGRAILLNVAGIFLLDLMGVVIKALSGDYGAAELSTYRNLFGMIPSFIVLWLSAEWHAGGRRMRIRQWRLAWLRGGCVTIAQFLFYLSLARLEFATATTISFAMSLFLTAFAVPILGERVGWVRWGAVVIGFAGVVMVMGPGTEVFSWDALLPLGAAMFYALTGATARLMDEDVPTALMNLYSSFAALVGALALCLATGGFSPIASAADMLWILAMGGFGGTGVFFLILSYRMAESSTLAPFNYFGIPFAFGMGWVFFGEAPVGRLFPGVLLIVAGGLIVVWRERRARAGR